MKFWIDACLSPTLEDVANSRDYQATSNRRRGLLDAPDAQLYRTVVTEDWIFVTNNEQDFRTLAGLEQLHPGLILMPQARRGTQQDRFNEIIAFIEDQAAADGEAPGDWMVMRLVQYVEPDNHISHGWLPDA